MEGVYRGKDFECSSHWFDRTHRRRVDGADHVPRIWDASREASTDARMECAESAGGRSQATGQPGDGSLQGYCQADRSASPIGLPVPHPAYRRMVQLCCPSTRIRGSVARRLENV